MKLLKIIGVIFVLVSLAIGLVIASYDPVEKAKIGQDEKLQQNAAAFIEASVQYYSLKGGLPWFKTEQNGVNCFDAGTTLPSIEMSLMQDCVAALIEDSSLPRDEISQQAKKMLVVTNPNPRTNNSLDTVVCFQPQSKTWQKDPSTKYNRDGSAAAPNTCYANGGSEFCYWCTQ
jgi:hypothetical protein